MRWKIPGLVLVALLVLGTVAAAAQEQPPTFGSDAEVVVLDVVATDDEGQPVSDLSEEDLQVSEDGDQCRILSFRLVQTAAAATSPTATATSVSPPTPAQPAATPARASLVVLVFDRMTTVTAPLARQGASDLISQSFPPDTWFAVFKVGYGIRMLAPFTTDTVHLHAAIEAATLGDPDKGRGPLGPLRTPRVTAPPPLGPVNPANPPIPDLGPVAGTVRIEEASLLRSNEGLDSLYAVRGLAQALSAVQGRKSVVYFAEAWHLPARTQPIYDEAVSAANRANVAVHTVDVRGLSNLKPMPLNASDSVLRTFSADYDGGAGLGARTPGPAAGGALGDGGMQLRKMEAMEERLGAPRLERLAEDTGGLAIQNTNDLGAGLSGVAQELRQYYEVVYAPADPVADGRFRKIGVKTSRRGVRLRTRVGYFATPGRTAAVHPYELPLLEALGASPPPHDFTLRAGLLHFAPKGEERECLVVAEVPLSEVQIASDETHGTYRAHLALLGHIKDEAGRVVARLTHDWPLEGPLVDVDTARRRSALFRRGLSLAPGRYVFEAAIQDRQTGARSVTRGPFEVPAAGGGLALASIVLPRNANARAAGASDSDPLRVGSLSLVPDLGTPLEAGTRSALPVYVGVYPTRRAEPVDLVVELRGNGEVLAEKSLELPPAGAGGRASWFGKMPIAQLAPGSYEIAVTAKQGEEVTEDRAGLEIAPSRRAMVAPARLHQPSDPELAPILERAARYVVAYQDTFRNIVAEERYSQRVQGRGRRSQRLAAGAREAFGREVTSASDLQVQNTRADLVFARLAGDVPWGVFRDVFQVNGSRVRDRDERLERLFREPSPSAMEQAWRILDESAHYNIGPRRTVNVPAMALLYLHPRNQSRFKFEKGKKQQLGGVEGLEVRFEEVQRPTLTRDSEGRSVPVSGRFWIDASRGTVLRSEARYRAGRAEGFITVEYRAEPRLAMWVPAEMQERYRNVPSSQEPAPRDSAEATARYSNYRQFNVTVEEVTATVEP